MDGTTQALIFAESKASQWTVSASKTMEMFKLQSGMAPPTSRTAQFTQWLESAEPPVEKESKLLCFVDRDTTLSRSQMSKYV